MAQEKQASDDGEETPRERVERDYRELLEEIRPWW